MRILILGQHGSGKSTLAQALSRSLLLPTISTGRMFRDIATQSTPAAQAVAAYLQSGTYLPDEVVVPLVQERLVQADVQNGFILEGYPRTLMQAEALQLPIDIVFHLQLPDELSRRRLLGRQRADDTAEAIGRRLQEYHEESSAVVEFYRQQGLLYDLDAQQSPEKVAEAALGYLRKVRHD